MAETSLPEPLLNSSSLLYYVGIGASAGGLEALESFFTNMPPKSGLAFIVIQHLSPDYKSLMVELLSKRTSMSVRRAENGMLVEPDVVYLIPPRKQLTIFHGKLILSDMDHSRGLNLPIDIFFRSLAEDQAERAIGIILSGTGSDGVRGIRAIKETGGMVMVQDEDSAKFDGMPRAAISTGLVDVVLPPEDMPDKLLSFTKMPFAVPASERSDALLSDEDGLTRIYALLREQTKVDFTLYKPSTVLRRIDRRMTVNQSVNLRDYVRLLETRPGEVTTLFRELLIGVTNFFRDREVFDDLATNILPTLLGDETQREFRFWVSGCSTGEEAYTLAILAKETMEKIKRHVNIKIFATDIDRDAILFAGNGLYPESIAADLPAGLLRKYFIPKDEHYQVHRSIREMVVFARHNLIKDPPFTKIDLLSCRNLLIYLQPVLQKKVFEFFNFSLNPQGIMLLGTSETPGEAGEFFEPVHHKHKIYRSRGKKNRTVEGPQFKTNIHDHEQLLLRPYARPNYKMSTREEERLLNRILDLLAEEFVPVMAIVNEHMELVHLTGDAHGYFRLPTGKQSNDITRMAVKELSIPLATGLQKIFHNKTEIKYTNVRLPDKYETRVIQLRIRLLSGRKGQDALAAVFIQEMSQAKDEKKRGKVEEFNISREAEERIRDLEQDLQFTKENLQATIEELETSNEELQATNEELLASNEELQSTNEELQSVNEELHTVNAEYQSKIMELTEITNDLENLITATQIATLFLDENLEIRKFTPELTQIFRIMQNDIGRPVSHLAHKLENIDLLSVIKAVEKSGLPAGQEVRTGDGKWFWMHVLPYAIGGPTASGMVLTFTSIDKLKDVEGDLQDSEDRYRLLFSEMLSGFALHEIICDDNEKPIDYRFLAVNSAFENLTGLNKDQILGKTVLEVMPDTEHFWIERYGRVALKGEADQFDGYSAAIGKYYEARAFCPERGKFAVMFHDVTERKETEIALRRSEENLNKAQRYAKIGSWTWDIKTDQVEWSDEMYDIFGIVKQNFSGSLNDIVTRSIHPNDIAKVEESNLSVASEGKPIPVEYRIVRPDGSICTVWAEAGELVFDENGKPSSLSGIVQDITERKTSENELLRSTRLLNATQRLTHVGGWQWEVGDQKMYWTDETYRIHGLEPGQIEPGSPEHVKQSLSCYVSKDRKIIEHAFQECVEKGISYDLEFPFTNLQGHKLHIRTSAHAVREGNDVVQVIGTIMEITPTEENPKSRKKIS